MSTRLFTITFTIFLSTTFCAFGEDSNQLGKHPPRQDKVLVPPVVDAGGFANQDGLPPVNYPYHSCFAGIGIPHIQISEKGYNPKHAKNNEQPYGKQEPTGKTIESYAQHDKTIVPALNKPIANQITAILAK